MIFREKYFNKLPSVTHLDKTARAKTARAKTASVKSKVNFIFKIIITHLIKKKSRYNFI